MVFFVVAIILVREVWDPFVLVSCFRTTCDLHRLVSLSYCKMSLVVILEVDLAVWNVSKWYIMICFILVYASQFFHVLLDIFAVAELGNSFCKVGELELWCELSVPPTVHVHDLV